MRILIADDDRPSRRLLAVNLAAGGHEVLEAEDGERAWAIIHRDNFRMVITDWMMPTLTGVDLIKRIRAEAQTGYVYTIILTALGEKSHVLEGLAAGADDYLTKPYYTEELLARVKIGERILTLEENLREAHRQMEYLAMHDYLTGLLNRRAIQEHLEAETRRAVRSLSSVSVILLDLDHFKSINDEHGHATGDQALRLFANTLAGNVRAYDWTGRWGGEEFLCILPGADPLEAGRVAERIRANTADLRVTESTGREFNITVSAGVAGASGALGDITVDQLLQAADVALYRAKAEGRNQICLAD